MQSRRPTPKPLILATSLAAGLALTAALGGCPNKTGPQPPIASVSAPTTPPLTPAPSWQPLPSSGEGAYSDAGYLVFGGNLRVEVREEGRVVPGALVKVIGPTLATLNTNAQGVAEFGPLAPGEDYRILVESPNRGTQNTAGVSIKKKATTPLRFDLLKSATVRGKVTADGKPVAGAVVSDGTNATISAADGTWSLDGVAAGSVTLSAGKPRYQPASKPVNAVVGTPATADLVLTPGRATAFFDASLGGSVGLDHLTKVRAHLGMKGWTMVDQPPGADGVWVAITPARDLTDAEIERMTTFVAQGGKLIMLGEWGGAGGFRTPAANALVHRFGLHFNADLLREPSTASNPAWLEISRFLPNHSAVAGLKSLQLYESCSLFGLVPMTQLAQTGPTGYRVQSVATAASQTVAAGGPYKAGKAIVVGDASAFTDDDADGDGTANATEAENLRFVEQLFDW